VINTCQNFLLITENRDYVIYRPICWLKHRAGHVSLSLNVSILRHIKYTENFKRTVFRQFSGALSASLKTFVCIIYTTIYQRNRYFENRCKVRNRQAGRQTDRQTELHVD
jgi:hypothetical protein